LKNGDTKKPLAYSKSEPAQAAGPEPTPEPTVEDLRRRLENLKKQALLSGWKPEMISERKRLSAAIYQAESGIAPADVAESRDVAAPEQNVLPKVSPKQRPNESHEGNRDLRIASLQDKGLDILSDAFYGEAESAASEAKRRNQERDGYLYGYRRVGLSGGVDDYAVVRQAAPEGFTPGDSVKRLEAGQVWQLPAGQRWRVSEADQKGFWGTFQVVGEDGKSGKRTTTINGMRDSVLLWGESGKAAPTEPKTAEEKVKWFGNQKKAQEYIDRKKLGDTHEVVPAGNKRFEIRKKATSKDSLTVQEFPYPEAVEGMADRIRDEVDQGVLDKVVAEASREGGEAGRPGYDAPVSIDARALKQVLESKGQPLVTNPAKLEAWKNGTASKTGNIEVAFADRDGGLDVNDGRHRIALAAERGEQVTVFVDA